MSESLKRNKNFEKRVIFLPRKQQKFLLKALNNLDVSWLELAEKIKVHKRTLNDWKREEYSMPLDVVKRISNIAKMTMPTDIEIKDPFWYVDKGSKIGANLGAIACIQKYGYVGGNPEYRKKKWYEWWKREGKYKYNFLGAYKPVNKPDFSRELAEFVGIVLGDGGISKRQIIVTLNSETDKEYGDFVYKLAKKLFKIHVGISYDRKCRAVRYILSRSKLVRFCVQRLGLKQGSKVKQQVDVPEWIKKNKQYSISCARGLIDTDGSVFTHRYKVGGKYYSYKKLCFTNYSKPLVQFVFNTLKQNGLRARISRDIDVWLDSKESMEKYLQIFSFHNVKHLKRYKS
ncbi:MAG: hypothetical protein KJI70_02110 [Patescibacteria group bacterium]|nr:hypothetical protein [Patescibacteria group bacterium]